MNEEQLKYIKDMTWQYFFTHEQISREKFEEILNSAEQIHKDENKTSEENPSIVDVYGDKSKNLNEPKNIGTLEVDDIIINILTFNNKREVAFTVSEDDKYDCGITIIRDGDEQF